MGHDPGRLYNPISEYSHRSKGTMIIITKMEPEYAQKNQMIGVKIELVNRGINDKRIEILLYVSEKGHSIAGNIFDKRDSINTYKSEIIKPNAQTSIYIPLKSGILIDRGVLSYIIELKEL
jgi:hypothetical protein